MSNPIMFDKDTGTLFVSNDSGVFAVELSTVSIGPMTRVDSIPETAQRWVPLSRIPRLLCTVVVTKAVRRAEEELARGDVQ